MNSRNNGGQHQLNEIEGLARQSSVYSLTFDEFQNTMGTFGKDYGSMNMDEFLKNIWTAEESQAMAVALGGSSGVNVTNDATGLQRQGSLTLPRTLSQKTVDEVWRDLVSAEMGPGIGGGAAAVDTSRQQRQQTLGEMTLEEFLVRAGVVREDLAPTATPSGPVRNSGNGVTSTNIFYGDMASANNGVSLSIGFGQPGRSDASVMTGAITHSSASTLAMTPKGARSYATALPLVNGVDMGNARGLRGGGIVNIVDAGMNNGLMSGVVGLGGSPVNHLSSDGIGKGAGDLSSVSPVPYAFTGGLRGRKSTAIEKVVERRQRRMIKNRESAARSRARKQAYTMELEAEVAKLKEQNQEMQKKQTEMMEMQKNQVLAIINQRDSKKMCLRRTLTGPW